MALGLILDKLSESERRKNRYGNELKDCEKIQSIIEKHFGCFLNLEEIRELWEAISDNRCAQWLDTSDSEEEIVGMIRSLLEKYTYKE